MDRRRETPEDAAAVPEMVYQPMLEVLAYLRANGFKTYIVSGGGVEFMRPWTERVYGIPPEQVVGSRAKLEYRSQAKAGLPCCGSLAIDLVDDRAGKPVGIQQADWPPGRLRPSATPMATSKCWGGRPRVRARVRAAWSTTPMRNASGPTTATRP